MIERSWSWHAWLISNLRTGAALFLISTVCLANDETRAQTTLSSMAQRSFCNIERADAAQMTPAWFRTEFEGRRPLILTNATRDWPSMAWDVGLRIGLAPTLWAGQSVARDRYFL